HAPYPVWLEKTTVGTAHTSWPSRCNGKVAAELPTWPYATNDWIDRKNTRPSWQGRPRSRSGCRCSSTSTGPSLPGMERFADQDLTEAEFRECVLDRARLIGVVMQDAEIDGLVTNLV